MRTLLLLALLCWVLVLACTAWLGWLILWQRILA